MELMNEMHVVSSFFFPFLYAFFLQKVACQERNEMLLNFSFFVLRLKQRETKVGLKLDKNYCCPNMQKSISQFFRGNIFSFLHSFIL